MYYVSGQDPLAQRVADTIRAVDSAVSASKSRLTRAIAGQVLLPLSLDETVNALGQIKQLEGSQIERWKQRGKAIVTLNDESLFPSWYNLGLTFKKSVEEIAQYGIEATPKSVVSQTIDQTKTDIVALPKTVTRNYWPWIVGGLGVYWLITQVFGRGQRDG